MTRWLSARQQKLWTKKLNRAKMCLTLAALLPGSHRLPLACHERATTPVCHSTQRCIPFIKHCYHSIRAS